jgi:hypothetical protein
MTTNEGGTIGGFEKQVNTNPKMNAALLIPPHFLPQKQAVGMRQEHFVERSFPAFRDSIFLEILSQDKILKLLLVNSRGDDYTPRRSSQMRWIESVTV